MAALKAKLCTARGKIYVDVGFWGGLNTKDWSDMPALVAGGVIGLQCTLVDTPEPVGKEYPAISKEQLDAVLQKINDNTLIAVHAEEQLNIPVKANTEEPKCYESFLRTRPAQMEINAVRTIADLALKHKK